ncbi:MAG: hypothetical protein OET44_01950 [Gammaproteobacteria bacterium]|nr:hypothetical protein [Gammaproteobacteria bacterium]
MKLRIVVPILLALPAASPPIAHAIPEERQLCQSESTGDAEEEQEEEPDCD